MPRQLFFDWLLRQQKRSGIVGQLATYAFHCRSWPRTVNSLCRLLDYAESNAALRDAIKAAHREWRAVR